MGDNLYRRGQVWYTRIGGRTVSLRVRDKQAAEKRRAELERRAADPAYAAAREATLERAVGDYIRSRRRLGRSAGTLHHVSTKAGHLLRVLPLMLSEHSHAETERYVDQRLEEGARRTTVKKELRVYAAALRLARRNGLLDCDPETLLPELEDDYEPRARFLAPWELVALVTALRETSDDVRAAHVVFIVATGARWGESLRALRADADLRDLADVDMVHLRGTKTKAARRDVPVVGPLRTLLRWALAQSPATEGERLFPAWPNVRRGLLAACKRAGIPPVSPNDLRRTFATWLRQAGVAPGLIAPAMGHTTSRMVERVYGKLPAADLARLLVEHVPAALGSTAAPVQHTGVDSGALEGSAVQTPETVSEPKTAENVGAQGRNRTADTGIFNPRPAAENADETSLFWPQCSADAAAHLGVRLRNAIAAYVASEWTGGAA